MEEDMNAFEILKWLLPIGRPLKPIGYQYKDLDWFDSGQGYFDNPFECDVYPQSFISNVVSYCA